MITQEWWDHHARSGSSLSSSSLCSYTVWALSSFLIIHKVGNIDIVIQLQNENKLEIAKNVINIKTSLHSHSALNYNWTDNFSIHLIIQI